jgi:hypothetical protein
MRWPTSSAKRLQWLRTEVSSSANTYLRPKGDEGTISRASKIETAKKGKGRGYTGKPQLEPPVKVPTDADRGVGKRQAASARKLASLGRAKRKKHCAAAVPKHLKRDHPDIRSICPGEYPSVRAAVKRLSPVGLPLMIP